MQTNAFYDAATHAVATTLPDGKLVRVPFGDFLDSQKRLAHSLREAAISAAIDAAWQRLRRLGRGGWSSPPLRAHKRGQEATRSCKAS